MDYVNELKKQRDILDSIAKEVRESGKPMTDEMREERAKATDRIKYLEDSLALELDTNNAKSLEERMAEKEEIEYREKKIDTFSPEPSNTETEYRNAFYNYLRRGDEAQLRSVSDYQSKTTSGDGGYLAPATLYDKIIKKRDAESIIRKYATVINISGDKNIPVEGSDVQASYVAEGASIDYTKQAFGTVPLTLRKMVAKVGITEELLSDAEFDIEAVVGDKIARVFSGLEETAFMNGTAANYQPVGILQSGITTTRTANANAITFADIKNVFTALPNQYRKNAVWIISSAMENALLDLNNSGNFPIYMPNVKEGVPGILLGCPVEVSKDLDATLGANKFQAVFGDLSYYIIGDKEGLSVSRYDDRYVDGKWIIRAMQRNAGNLTNTDAVKILQCKAS